MPYYRYIQSELSTEYHMAKKSKFKTIREVFEVVSSLVSIAKDSLGIYSLYRRVKKNETCDCENCIEQEEDEVESEEEELEEEEESEDEE